MLQKHYFNVHQTRKIKYGSLCIVDTVRHEEKQICFISFIDVTKRITIVLIFNPRSLCVYSYILYPDTQDGTSCIRKWAKNIVYLSSWPIKLQGKIQPLFEQKQSSTFYFSWFRNFVWTGWVNKRFAYLIILDFS